MDGPGRWEEQVRAALPGFFEPLEVVASLPSTMARAAELAGAVGGAAPAGAVAVGLKWPNDLELGGRKAAGLLAEAHLEGERLGWVVLGMGVNVSQRREDLPPELADRATSVALALGTPVDRAALLAAWAERFVDD